MANANQLFNFIQGSDITGESAYDIWRRAGYVGTEEDFLEFLQSGPKGDSGEQGAPADPVYLYFLQASTNVVKKGADNVFVPGTVAFKSFSRQGGTCVNEEYLGRFVISETVDGNVWNKTYESSMNENVKVYNIVNQNAKMIKCELYEADGFTNLLDTQSTAVLTDISNIEIGARNLILHSDVEYDVNSVYELNLADFELQRLVGKDCAFSIFVGPNNFNPADNYVEFIATWKNDSNESETSTVKLELVNTEIGERQKFNLNFVNPVGYNTLDNIVVNLCLNTEVKTKVSRPKFEIGKVATEWLPAPEDLQSLVAILSNDSHIVSIDKNGTVDYSDCESAIQVFYGNIDITSQCNYEVISSDTVNGNWNSENYTFSVTEISGNSGYVDIIASYKNTNITKRFTVSKVNSAKGEAGKSTYDIWKELGNEGTAQDFLDSLKGNQGPQGNTGEKGEDGKSAYEIWLELDGNAGKSEEEFLNYLTDNCVKLNSSGKIDASQLPSYVDDVIEGYILEEDLVHFYSDEDCTNIIQPESGKIYVAININKSYRWSGSQYSEIASSIALGETSSTAYPGNKGKELADKVTNLINNNLPISKGSGEDSIVIGDGNAQGKNSIAGGSNDVDEIDKIKKMAEYAGYTVDTDNPTAYGDGSLVLGVGSKAHSLGSMSIGISNSAGVKGFYWHSIDWSGEKPVIQLSTEQKPYYYYKLPFVGTKIPVNETATWNSEAGNLLANWVTSDKLTIVNNAKYGETVTISSVEGSIDTANGRIIVDSLPFTESDVKVEYASLDDIKSLVWAFDDYSIYNPSKPSAGIIEFAYGALSIGLMTNAAGSFSSALGYGTKVTTDFGHAEGKENIAGYAAHAEGAGNKATGDYSHAEGLDTIAKGMGSHTEGDVTKAYGNWSHAEGFKTQANAKGSHAEGGETGVGKDAIYAHAEGYNNEVSAKYAHVEGDNNTIHWSAQSAHVEGGNNNVGDGAKYSHIEGEQNQITGSDHCHIEGMEGYINKGSMVSHVEGRNNGINENSIYSHAEGFSNRITGNVSHAEGGGNIIEGEYVHAEGRTNKVYANDSHIEGYMNTISEGANHSHAEGHYNFVRGKGGHVEGRGNYSIGEYSHAEGNYTIADGQYQHVQGKYNKPDRDAEGNPLNKYAHIVGNGKDENNRSNAHTLDWDGNAWYAGDVYVGPDNDRLLKTEDVTDYNKHEIITAVSGGTLTHPGLYDSGYNQIMTIDEVVSYWRLNRTFPDGDTLVFPLSTYFEDGTYTCIDKAKINNVIITEEYTASERFLSLFQVTGPNVKSITIPKSITTIESGGYDCDIYYLGSQSDWDKISIEIGNNTVDSLPDGYTLHLNASLPTITSYYTGVLKNNQNINLYPTTKAKLVELADGSDLETKLNNISTSSGIGKSGKGTNAEIFNDYSKNNAIGIYSHVEGAENATGGSASYSHAEGYKNQVSAPYAHIEGTENSIHWSGEAGHVEGSKNTVGENSTHPHVEGYNNTISAARYIHVEGFSHNVTSSRYTHVEGQGNTVNESIGAHIEGWNHTVSGEYTHAEGAGTTVSGYYSHAEGSDTTASSSSSHAEGDDSIASEHAAHAEGGYTEATAKCTHAEGYASKAKAYAAHAEGRSTAEGEYSHSEGYYAHAKGQYSHAGGRYTIAAGNTQWVHGKYNIEDTSTDINTQYAMIIGNGSSEDKRSNAYTLDWYGKGSFAKEVASNGADYAEFFEWQDGNTDNEDRVGYIVALDGDKIKFANSNDEVLGIISGTVAVLGDNYECEWNGKYLTDDFGRTIYEDVEEFVEVERIICTEKINEETNEKELIKTIEKEVKSIGFVKKPKLNPNFDSTKEYINRANRPEWATVGMMGKLYVRDNGTCEVNGYAMAGENGIATKSEEKTNMRVLNRVNENVIRVLLK